MKSTFKLKRKQALAAYVFIAPAYVLFTVFLFVPVVWALYLGFTNYDIFTRSDWVGLDNFAALMENKQFWQALRNTSLFAFEVIPLNIAISIGLALLVNRTIKGISLFRAAYYLPVVTSIIAVSMIWLWLYDPRNGLFNYFLEQVGLPAQTWLKDPDLALHSLVLMRIWKGVGWNMVIFLAGLQAIPKPLYEAAAIEGANRWQRFWRITWPLLAPTTFFVFIMAIISTFQTFGEIYTMTQGGPVGSTTTVVYLIFTYGFDRFEMGMASAIALVLFVIILALSLFNMLFVQKRISYDL